MEISVGNDRWKGKRQEMKENIDGIKEKKEIHETSGIRWKTAEIRLAINMCGSATESETVRD